MTEQSRTKVSVSVVWASGLVGGEVFVKHGELGNLSIDEGTIDARSFQSSGQEGTRLVVGVDRACLDIGAHSTLITVRTQQHAFSFFARDVNAEWPIWIPEYGVAVTTAGDSRDYNEIAAAIQAKGLRSGLQRIEAEPEETYEAACAANRDQMCPTWLGVGRDVRIFRVGYEPTQGFWGYVEPRFHSVDPSHIAPESTRPKRIGFCIGKGESCEVVLSRRLEDGVLPILNSTQKDGDVAYNLTAFATLENQPLNGDAVRGTEWHLAYPQTGGNMCTREEKSALSEALLTSIERENEELVCCIRVTAVNEGEIPKYAWFKGLYAEWTHHPEARCYVAESGTLEADGLAVGINRINGQPMPQEEMAILLPPGGAATMELIIPHQPLSRDRATRLATIDLDQHLDACRQFWREKLNSAAKIHVPEPAVNERIQAGLLHCDLVALGREPDGNVLATIGWYAPIGSESSPIIQFFDCMGWHKLAQRCIQFFLDRQDENGFIQTFARYQLETGGVLWTMGEHYRYTGDNEWLARNRAKVLKSCDYLLAWRNRNKRDDLRGKGFGLQDGKVADPEDFFHSFMLNALSYLGIQRSAGMLAVIDPESSARLADEARAYREDIRIAFREATANAPVIPTGDGSWVPAAPPWTDYTGALALYAEGGKWWTHGAFGSRDTLIGPLYLAIGECLEPDDLETVFLNRAHHELFTIRNAGLTQPYYCRHDYIHLRRGEVKAYLKTFYNQFTAIQDRETYTFWEHYHHASQHKTHEEGWFLMQVRWMLWLEEGDTLKLLSAIPRRWLEDGKSIELRDVACYFGQLSLTVHSRLEAAGVIEAVIECKGNNQPAEVAIRIPHPEGMKARTVEGGVYNGDAETVQLKTVKGKATVTLAYW